jgi:cytochrome oxidase Cu insertion factor (SCO1/SenC/PrrC family)
MRHDRGVLARGRWLLAVLVACCALGALGALGVFAPAARADGDPASDVLVYQNLFVTSESGMSSAQQAEVANLLTSAARDGFPIRVAIIAAPVDLGAVPALFGKPPAYANFLGIELSLVYKQRLLVVMPNGFGFNWTGHQAAAAYGLLAKVPVGAGGTALTTATVAAVRTLAAASGVKLAAPAPVQPATAPPHGGVTTRQAVRIALIVIAALAVADGLFRLVRHRRRWWPRLVSVSRALAGWVVRTLPRPLRRPLVGTSVAACVVLAAAAGIAVTMVGGSPAGGASIPQAALLAENPALDPGKTLSGAAPGFTLTDQSGQPVSLSSYRGKVVILTFGDPKCTAACAITTAALRDAKTMLGAAGAQVQLLAVDTNPTATATADVRAYSRFHGMSSQWRFLTGSLPRLRSVWTAYSLGGVTISQNQADHAPPVFVIAPDGTLAKLYLTRQSYAAAGQFGQLLAGEAARLLPTRPPVRPDLSYARIAGTSPAVTTTLPRAKGGVVPVGPGVPGQPRLYLFFATWDQQVTSLASQLVALNGYQLAAGAAGLPSLTAVDEGSVEASPAAVTRFLAGLKSPLWYEVAVDPGGKVADGYQVRDAPWFVLAAPSGQILWSWDVSSSGWPARAALDQHVRAALARAKPH